MPVLYSRVADTMAGKNVDVPEKSDSLQLDRHSDTVSDVERDGLLLGGGFQSNDEYRPRPRSRLHLGLKYIALLFFIVTYTFLAAQFLWSSSWFETVPSACVLGNEKAYSDAPILYKTESFQRAGFHDSTHQEVTKYEGRPNQANSAAWDRLLSVGIISISEEENSQLSISTAALWDKPAEHVVELEVFHQLHCLKRLRHEFWQLQDAVTLHLNMTDMEERQDHVDHCIDYLRQVVMCHGDLTPITFEWNDELGTYLARHKTKHQCRDFEAIFQWAKGRDDTGMKVDGDHKNVELKTPEHSD